MPLFVSFFTRDTAYEELARRLRVNLDEFGISHDIRGLDDTGQWVTNCALKGGFVQDMMKELEKPFVWLDLDAQVVKRPTLFEDLSNYDMALYIRPGCDKDLGRYRNVLISNVMMFNPTKRTLKVLKRWRAINKENPLMWDQQALALAVKELNPKVLHLPDYYNVRYLPKNKRGWSYRGPKEDHVIRQFQVSRVAKGRRPHRALPEHVEIFSQHEKAKKQRIRWE